MPALAIPFIVGSSIAAGGSVAAAAIGAHASGSAASQQENAANQALQLEQQQFQRSQAAFAPYQQATQGILPRLANWTVTPGPVTQHATLASLSGYGGMPGPGAIAPLGGGGPSMGQPSTPPMAGQPQAPQPGAMVTLRAPNGQQQAVPQAQAQHYIQQGATVVQ